MIPIHSPHMYNNNTLLYYSPVHLDDNIPIYRIFNTELVTDCFLYFQNYKKQHVFPRDKQLN